MAGNKSSRENILDEAERIFRFQGYSRTAIKEIADACGILKGSLYHYFASKEDILLGVLDRIQERFEDQIFTPLCDETTNPCIRASEYARDIAAIFYDKPEGCLVANLLLEMYQSDKKPAERMKRFFERWEEAVGRLIETRYDWLIAKEIARDHVGLVQGGLMLIQLHGDDHLFRRTFEEIRKPVCQG